jgi:hypothetical protein
VIAGHVFEEVNWVLVAGWRRWLFIGRDRLILANIDRAARPERLDLTHRRGDRVLEGKVVH